MKTKSRHFRVIVATLLAVIMLFGALAVAASATDSQTDVIDTPWYTVTHDSESDSIDIVIKTDLKEYTEITPDDLKELWAKMKDILVDVIVEDIKAANSTSTFSLMPTFNFNSTQLLKTYFGELSIHTPEDVKNIDRDTLAQILHTFDVTEQDFAQVDIKEVFEEHADELIEAGILLEEDVYVEDPETGVKSFNTELESSLVEKQVEVSEKLVEYDEIVANGGTVEVDYVEIAVHAILPAIKDVIISADVDGEAKDYDLYHEGYFVSSVIKDMAKDLIPTPDELENMTEFDERYGVLVTTGYGDISFSLGVKCEGDFSKIASLFEVVNRYVDISRENDGTVNLDLRVPDGFANALLKLCKTDKLSDGTKLKIFSAVTGDVNNAYGFYENLTFDEIIEILEKIDFEGILDSERVKQYIDLTGLTNEEILGKISALEEYYNKASRLVAKLFGKLPDSAKARTLADFYDGDGVFSASVNETVNIESVLENVIPERAATIAAFIDRVDFTVKANATVSFEDIHRVEYIVGGKSVTVGFLPADADVVFFADMTVTADGAPIFFWADENGAAVTKMPNRDVVLTANTDFVATLSGDVTKTYDGLDATLTASALYDIPGATYTYKWYKDGNLIAETGAVVTVKNVLDSGSYYCVVSVSYNGWQDEYTTEAATVAISPKPIDVSGVVWDYTDPFVYNKAPHTVAVKSDTLPAGVTVQYSGDVTATVVGSSYVANATFSATDPNYTASGSIAPLTWAITKAKVDFTGVSWNYTAPFTYDKSEKSVALSGVPADFTVTYSNAAKTNAGTYTATFSYDTDNYEIINSTVPFSLEWTVNKATYDMSGVTFSDKTVVYDGTAQSITVSGTLPEGVTVQYSEAKTEVGVYTMTATFLGDYENYNEIAPMTAKLTIKAAVYMQYSLVLKDGNGNVILEITSVGGIGSDHDINFKDTTFNYEGIDVSELLDEGKIGILCNAYDIHFTKSGTVVGLEDEFTVKLRIPSSLKSKDLMVVYIDDNGNVTDMNATVDGDYLVFETTHFSVYAIFEITDAKAGGDGGFNWIWIIILIIVLLIAAAVVFFLLKRKKNTPTEPTDGANEEPDGELPTPEEPETVEAVEEPVAEEPEAVEAVEEPVAEEPETVEAVEEPVAEEPVAVEAVEEPVAEEPETVEAVEEPVAEEPEAVEAVEEPVAEEPETVEAVEEPVAEEPEAVEAVEEPVAEEPEAVEAVEEPVAEEPEAVEAVEEPVAEEPEAVEAVEEPVAEEPEAVEAVEESVAKPEPVIVPVPVAAGDDAILVRYRSSYMSRLIQSEPPVQDYYNVIKNTLLSYKGVKARTSWNFESFNKGRVQCVKLNVKGKALIMYLALNPTDYNEAKYHFTDVSDKPKLDQVPMMLKIRSARALGYAVELIDELMAQLGIEKLAKPKEVDYHMPYETTEALVERELIKVILPKGVKLNANSNVEKADVSEIIDNANAEAEKKVSEEPVVEEPAVEEPAVEETVVEEPEAAEAVEEPAIEEPIFEEVVHVNSAEADLIVTDERAEEIIEHVHKLSKGSGKMCEINLDTICDNFDDGDTVTIAELKARRLINPKAGRIKVLARGVMTKTLVIYAEKFSLQAVKMITLAGGHAKQLD